LRVRISNAVRVSGFCRPAGPRDGNKKGEARGPRPEKRLGIVARQGGRGNDVDAATFTVKPHLAILQREQGPITTGAHIVARDELGAALADEDAAGGDQFTAKSFHTQPFADAVASVAAAALTFLVCHNC
jgi:hypothetical protein